MSGFQGKPEEKSVSEPKLFSEEDLKQIKIKLNAHASRSSGVIKVTIDDWLKIAKEGVLDKDQLKKIYASMAYLMNFFAKIFVGIPDDPKKWEKVVIESGMIPIIRCEIEPLLADELKKRDKSASVKLVDYFYSKIVFDLVDKIQINKQDLSDEIAIYEDTTDAKKRKDITEVDHKHCSLLMAFNYLELIRNVVDDVCPETISESNVKKVVALPVVENIRICLHQVDQKLIYVEFWMEKIAFLSAIIAYAGALAALGLLGSNAILIGIVILGVTALLWLILIGLRGYCQLALNRQENLILELEDKSLQAYLHKIEKLAEVAYLKIPFEISQSGDIQLTGESQALPKIPLHKRSRTEMHPQFRNPEQTHHSGEDNDDKVQEPVEAKVKESNKAQKIVKNGSKMKLRIESLLESGRARIRSASAESRSSSEPPSPVTPVKPPPRDKKVTFNLTPISEKNQNDQSPSSSPFAKSLMGALKGGQEMQRSDSGSSINIEEGSLCQNILNS